MMKFFDDLSKTTTDQRSIVNTIFNSQGLGSFEDMLSSLQQVSEENKRLNDLAEAGLFNSVTSRVLEEAFGEIPEGEVYYLAACDVFPSLDKKYTFKVPFWGWKGEHPSVPITQINYIFREEYLLPILWSLLSNEKTWLKGHTGTGKSTLIEQVAARLNYPFGNINLNSDISVYDLVGKMDLLAKDGASETVWVDGVLPKFMASPYMMVVDEFDSADPGPAFIFHRLLEGGSLRILEEGGREVYPHPMFRFFATANTNGQGDEHGIYQGTRPQSGALLNRITNWIDVEYMSPNQIGELIQSEVPTFREWLRLSEYVNKHQNMFENNEVTQPISPRTFVALAKKACFYKTVGVDGYLLKAFKDTVVSACNSDDSRTLIGLFERIF